MRWPPTRRFERVVGTLAALTALLLVVTTALLHPAAQLRATGTDTWHAVAGARQDPPTPAAERVARILPRRVPLVIAHRGASAFRPENTLGAFRYAIEQGADYIEGDLGVTRDGVLVARHDAELSATTDVASHGEYADRRVTRQVDGTTETGWFVQDFTLAELRTLRATVRGGPGRPGSPGSAAIPPPDETIPTVTQLIELAQVAGLARGRPVGLYLELKSPAHYRSVGLPEEPRLVAALRAAGLPNPRVPVFVESFDTESLQRVHRAIAVPLVQLIWGAAVPGDTATSPEGLRAIAGYAVGLGLQRVRLQVPGRSETGPGGLDRSVVDAAHRAGLEVHVYTFDDPPHRPEAVATYRAYYTSGVDGVFTDNPDAALAARTG